MEELMIDEGEAWALRQKLVADKMALQTQLGELNAKCSVILPKPEYHKIQSQRAVIVKQLGEKERELAELKIRRVALNVKKDIERVNKGMPVSRVRDLVELRDRWHGFSMEPKNHQKAREAAWKFSQELGQILKLHFDRSV